MTFAISFPKVLRRTMGLKDFGKLYDSLLGLEIIIVNEVLKYEVLWQPLDTKSNISTTSKSHRRDI